MRSGFFFGLILLFAIAMLYLVRPFLYPIFWAAVIAVICAPVYRWILKYLKLPKVSSLFAIGFVILAVLLPLGLVAGLLVNESVDLYNKVAGGTYFTEVRETARRLEGTALGPVVAQVQEQWTSYAANVTKTVSLFLFENVKKLTQVSLWFLFLLFIMLYSLYYFFKDGPQILKRIMHLSPLGDTYEALLYDKFTSTARATLKSTLIIGGVQGALGGILFWATGIEGALVWAVIMAVFSIIPAVGPFLVWLPAGIIMLALGNFGSGLVILIGGSVISFVDNLLRPPLLGKDTEMHPLIVLFATLGGILLFGISGFIIGPIIAALFLAVVSIYDYYYRNELQNN